MNDKKCETLKDMCDVFNFSQLISKPMCFKKDYTPSLVDVIITNKINFCFNYKNLTGISDCPNLFVVTLKGKHPVQTRGKFYENICFINIG